jgi:gamma-glutamyltranspeptidase / glutathione hydrolase
MTSPLYAHQVVATSQALASQAGLHAMRSGGNAVDAALATAITLAVVEPVSNGVGGDMFATVWDGKALHGINASGVAPALLHPSMYASKAHVPLTGWASASLPGAVAGWLALSKRWGKLPFAKLFDAAIDYAAHGFPVGAVVEKKWAREATRLKDQPGFLEVFTTQGEIPKIGQCFKNPALARSLALIAQSEGQALYSGEIGQSLVAHAHQHGGMPGAAWRLDDLRQHEALWQTPLSVRYRDCDIWQLPPNGQGMAALLAMGMLNRFERPSDDVQWLHLQAECIKQSFAQMYPYLADARHLPTTPQDWLAADCLDRLAKEISVERAQRYGPAQPPWGGTVYVTTADSSGYVVSLIQSTFFGFGSGIADPATGIHMNNRLACFSLDPAHPNALAGGKRPMNTIIPGFATRNGQAAYSLGVTGGPIQPQGQMQLLTQMIDDQRNVQEATSAPRWKIEHAHGDVQLDFEAGFDAQLVQGLRARGHREAPPGITGLDFGGAFAIECLPENVYAISNDPRRDGAAVGY